MSDNEKKSKAKQTIKLNKDQMLSLYKAKENEIKEIYKKIHEVDTLFTEINKAENTLKEILNTKPSEKMLINIGAGILVECNVSNVKEVKVSLPGTIMLSKDINDVISDIDNRKKELSDIRERLTQNYANNVNTLNQISLALKDMHKHQQKDSNINKVS